MRWCWMCVHSVIKLSQRWEETVSADVFCLLTSLSVWSACITQKSSVCFTVSYCEDQFKIIANCVIVVMTAVVISNLSTSSDLLTSELFSSHLSSALMSLSLNLTLLFSDLTLTSVVSAVLVCSDFSLSFSSIWSFVWSSVSETSDSIQRCSHPFVFYEIIQKKHREQRKMRCFNYKRCLSF